MDASPLAVRHRPTIRTLVRLLLALGACSLALALLARPAAACTVEDPAPDPAALVRHAVLVVVGTEESPPEGEFPTTLDVRRTMLGTAVPTVDLTTIVGEDCGILSLAPPPGTLGLWVFGDLSAISVQNTGVWPLGAGGRIADGWPPGRPLEVTSLTALEHLLAVPATDTNAATAAPTAPPTPSGWPVVGLATPASLLVLQALRRRLRARTLARER